MNNCKSVLLSISDALHFHSIWSVLKSTYTNRSNSFWSDIFPSSSSPSLLHSSHVIQSYIDVNYNSLGYCRSIGGDSNSTNSTCLGMSQFTFNLCCTKYDTVGTSKHIATWLQCDCHLSTWPGSVGSIQRCTYKLPKTKKQQMHFLFCIIGSMAFIRPLCF